MLSLKENKQEKIIYKLTLFSRLVLTIQVTIQGVDVNVFNGHNIGLQEYLESMSIHNILISLDLHDCYRSRW
jgi:hypothetical protein